MESLPAELRDIQSLAIFKCKLETYLFHAGFTTQPVDIHLLVLLIKFIIIIINILYYYYYYYYY